MSSTHVVKQGEHLSGIAYRYGFSGYKVIWDYPANAGLKKLRENPSILLPGDELVIPDREPRVESRPVDARHRFVAPAEELELRLSIRDGGNKPVKGVKFLLVVEGVDAELDADGQGVVEKKIPKTSANALLLVRDPKRLVQLEVGLKIGHLDPVDTRSGQMARLNNLGYMAGDADDPTEGATTTSSASDPAEAKARKERFKSAVEEFQCDSGLHVDGVCGRNTQAKLREVHGC